LLNSVMSFNGVYAYCVGEDHMVETAVRGVRKILSGKLHNLLYSFSFKYIFIVIGESIL